MCWPAGLETKCKNYRRMVWPTGKWFRRNPRADPTRSRHPMQACWLAIRDFRRSVRRREMRALRWHARVAERLRLRYVRLEDRLQRSPGNQSEGIVGRDLGRGPFPRQAQWTRHIREGHQALQGYQRLGLLYRPQRAAVREDGHRVGEGNARVLSEFLWDRRHGWRCRSPPTSRTRAATFAADRRVRPVPEPPEP
jgi:hypothetical protein